MAKKNTPEVTTRQIEVDLSGAPSLTEMAGPAIPTCSVATVIAQLRAAASFEDALKVLSPSPRQQPNATYEIVEDHTGELPQKRGACIKVYAAAVRKAAPFTAADIVTLLPGVKSAAYWTRRLAKEGFFRDTQGQDLVEYVLLVSLIALATALAFPPVTQAITAVFDGVASMVGGG